MSIDCNVSLRSINKNGIRKDKNFIKQWLQIEETQRDNSICHFSYFLSLGYEPWDQKWYTFVMNKMGCTKVFVTSLSLLYNIDNEDSEEKSYQEYGEHCARKIDSLQQMLISIGVVAALILSLTLGIINSDTTISESAEEFFSETTILAFYYIHMILLLISVFESMYLIFMTTKMFWEIGLMYDIDMKIWWLRQSKVGPLYDSADIMLASLGFSIPFAVCLYNPKVISFKIKLLLTRL